MSEGLRRHCEICVLTSWLLVELEATLPLAEPLVEPVAERLEVVELLLLATASVDVDPVLLLLAIDGTLELPVELLACDVLSDVESELLLEARPPVEADCESDELELLDGDDVPVVSWLLA